MSASDLNETEIIKLHALNNNLEYFAATSLYIKTKKGGEPQHLKFNLVQKYIDAKLNDMKKRTGWVRAIIVKARQQTCSTYISGRFFKDAVCIPGTNVYILTHESDATTTLFGKVALFYEMLFPGIKPEVDADNRTTLALKNKSEYKVGTAGSKNTGRSKTAQRMHRSEVAHFPDEAVPFLDSGVMQIVADLPDTEIIDETTANGFNWFYKFVMDSLKGKTDYEVIFIPWFWTAEYQRAIPKDFQLDPEEKKIKARHNLTNEQIYWRRKKIASFKIHPLKQFMQEYPATLQEAFQASNEGMYDIDRVRSAMSSKVSGRVGALVLGVDLGGASKTADRSVFALRRGRQLVKLWKFAKMTALEAAGRIANIIDEYGVDRVCIDKAYGTDVVELLHDRGYYEAETVSFAETADSDEYANKRAEMAFRFRDWLDEGEAGDVSLPEDEEMAMDIACIPEPTQNNQGRWILPAKKEIKKLLGFSPDIYDAIILTFARLIKSSDQRQIKTQKSDYRQEVQSELITATRRRSGGEDRTVTVKTQKPFSFKRNR